MTRSNRSTYRYAVFAQVRMHATGSGDYMSIHKHCDFPECTASYRRTDHPAGAGWVWIAGRDYCPHHRPMVRPNDGPPLSDIDSPSGDTAMTSPMIDRAAEVMTASMLRNRQTWMAMTPRLFAEALVDAGWHDGPKLTELGTCDWGGCDKPVERFRCSEGTWLPVCYEHSLTDADRAVLDAARSAKRMPEPTDESAGSAWNLGWNDCLDTIHGSDAVRARQETQT